MASLYYKPRRTKANPNPEPLKPLAIWEAGENATIHTPDSVAGYSPSRGFRIALRANGTLLTQSVLPNGGRTEWAGYLRGDTFTIGDVERRLTGFVRLDK